MSVVRSNIPGQAPLHVWPDYDDGDNGDICEVKNCRLPAARQTTETSVLFLSHAYILSQRSVI